MRAEKIKEGKILVVKYFKRERWRYKLANVVKVSDFYVNMSDGSNLEIKDGYCDKLMSYKKARKENLI